MKTIKINESQRHRLFEVYSEGFSLEYLSMIGHGQFAGEDNTEAQFEYCHKYLGEPLAYGSARCVFQLTDNYVLKLSLGYQGFIQNENEAELFRNVRSNLLVRIIYCDDDYSFIVSEQVLPAESEDFEKYVGIPYYRKYEQDSQAEKDNKSKYNGDKKIGFNKYFRNIKPHGTISNICIDNILDYMQGFFKDGDDKIYEPIIKSNVWLRKLNNLVRRYKVYDLYKGNFGIVNRNGRPLIVVLDTGINYKYGRSEE